MKNFNEFTKDLKELIAIESVNGKKEKDAPFGKNVKEALNKFLSIAKGFNFKTVNYDNYGGEVIVGNGEEVGIIGHIDIVPVGNGWDTPPLELVVKDGNFYGRGVADDKLPTLLILYVLKELTDDGVKFNKKFRLIVGCNEETGWQDVEYIKKKTKLPKYGFSPDGNFPVSYSEKGIYILSFELPKFKNFKNLEGGFAVNAVCDKASVIDSNPNDELIKKYNLERKGNTIISHGIASHGSAPQNGVNAFINLFLYMKERGEEVDKFLDLFFDTEKIMQKENEQGNITYSLDIVEKEGGKSVIKADCRIPAPFTFDTVKENFDRFGIKYTVLEKHPPFMVDKNSEFVNCLLNAYNDKTGENLTAVKMGGSTFARVFNKGCAFGMEFKNCDYKMHTANEFMPISDIEKGYEIYKQAIINLNNAKLD